MKIRYLFLLFIISSMHVCSQDQVRHFSAGAEVAFGMAGIADFSSLERYYGPRLGMQAGLFTSRYFCDPAYFEIGVYGSRRGNRRKDVAVSTIDPVEICPTYLLWYLDVPFRVYFRVGKSRHWESFLFLGYTTSFLSNWESTVEEGQVQGDFIEPENISYSMSYGLAFENESMRIRLNANMALCSLSREARTIYGVTYIPFELLASCAYIIR